MTTKFWLGILLGASSLIGLILTALVLFAVLKICIYERRNPVYIMSASNLLCDCVQLVLAVGYLAPSIILDSWFFDGGRYSVFVQIFTAVLLLCWDYCSIVQILIAINRLVVVCFSNVHFFSFKTVLIIVILLWPIAALLVYLTQYGTPCCR
ncbi:hypothetical protein OESDEN_03001 [Oesophagostomum dentatum]|uniref:G-protein coupled receptors family 1 profile domain-containing protein n=1 Tax=Oesophagostomum dentatum TaxID=61180 RepID=A0A0B1TNP8_OESDE|nr:hypothetical protein OESDEN_03001 [Oesophagostomum dentatum]